MKALIFRETGEPKSVLELAEIPTPPLAPGEVLVRVLLSPINASDLHMVRGRYGYQPELPASPGIEGVGIVEALGPGLQGPRAGTRVIFIHTWNTWREQIVCPADKLVPVPADRRRFLHQSFDGVGIDHINSQPQGGGLASADGGWVQRGKVCASVGAAVSIQD